LLVAIAAQHGADLYGTDTKQAFLYGDMAEDEDVYVQPPELKFDQIPEGHVFRLKKAIYGTKQAARRWHTRISTWMEENGYPAVNSEKTIFMKRTGDDFFIHGLFVDDIRPRRLCLTSSSLSIPKSSSQRVRDHWRTADDQISGFIC
jgi:hypothetical protein